MWREGGIFGVKKNPNWVQESDNPSPLSLAHRSLSVVSIGTDKSKASHFCGTAAWCIGPPEIPGDGSIRLFLGLQNLLSIIPGRHACTPLFVVGSLSNIS